MKYTELILLASRTFLSLSETTILGKEHIISKDIIVHSFRCEKFSQSFFSDTTFNIFVLPPVDSKEKAKLLQGPHHVYLYDIIFRLT